jgi:hypothetical protein
MQVRGDDAVKIQRRAGQVDLDARGRYFRRAEAMREGSGSPFPSLPLAPVSHAAIARAL